MMSDLISREAAIHILRYRLGREYLVEEIKKLPSAQPLEKLKEKLAELKRAICSENRDYLTGYLCALSVMEGMIAEVEDDE